LAISLRQLPFRNGGGCPIATVLADGTTAETAAVSDEGMLGSGRRSSPVTLRRLMSRLMIGAPNRNVAS
jgi:hypothetical protein